MWERAANVVLGLVFAGWAVRAVVVADESDRYSLVRLGLAGTQILVGVLFMLREPLRRDAGWWGCLAALPSMVLGGAALACMPPIRDWPLVALALFAVGLALAFAGLATLGRSFAIFPAERGIVTGGPYAFIRHPAYAGELLIVAAVVLAGPSWVTGGILLALLPALVLRIMAEERLLAATDEYTTYCEQVPWRLLPGVW